MIDLTEFLSLVCLNYEVIGSHDLRNKYISSAQLDWELSNELENNNYILPGHVIIINASQVNNIKRIKPIPETILVIASNETIEISDKIKKFSSFFDKSTTIIINTKISEKELYYKLIEEISKEATHTKELLYTHYINLVHLLTQGAEIGRIEEMAYRILDNPMIITDESYKVIAYSHSIKINDPIWLTIVGNKYCPASIVKMTDYNEFWKRLNKEGRPLFVDSDDFSPYTKRAVAEIKSGGKTKGYIALLEVNKKITLKDLQTLQMVAELVGIKLTEKDAVSKAIGQLEHELIGDLFSGRINNETMARNRVQSLGWSLNKWYFVLNIKDSSKESKYIGKKLDYIKARLSEHFSFCNYSINGSNSFFIMGSDDKEKSNKILRKEIKSFMEKENLICCIGSIVNNLMDIHISYEEAKTTSNLIELLSQERLRKSVYFYNEVAILDILMKITQQMDISCIISRSIETLKNIDKKEGTEYIETLKRFFENNQNSTSTAHSMFLHRNTVNYRLNRIREIIEDDFDNPLVRLHLYISILVEDILI